jgi:hypothetical protein
MDTEPRTPIGTLDTLIGGQLAMTMATYVLIHGAGGSDSW